MTERELRRLSRAELIELLIEQMEENESLRKLLKKAQEKIEQRDIAIRSTGSIAEAALKLNGVFEAADRAAKQYLDSVRAMAGEEKIGEIEAIEAADKSGAPDDRSAED